MFFSRALNKEIKNSDLEGPFIKNALKNIIKQKSKVCRLFTRSQIILAFNEAINSVEPQQTVCRYKRFVGTNHVDGSIMLSKLRFVLLVPRGYEPATGMYNFHREKPWFVSQTEICL